MRATSFSFQFHDHYSTWLQISREISITEMGLWALEHLSQVSTYICFGKLLGPSSFKDQLIGCEGLPCYYLGREAHVQVAPCKDKTVQDRVSSTLCSTGREIAFSCFFTSDRRVARCTTLNYKRIYYVLGAK